MKKLFVFLCFALLFSSFSFSQGYQISLKIHNLADTNVVVGYYYGKYQYTRDTIRLNQNGVGKFETTDTVGGGMYFVVLPNKQYFEFILDKERNLNFETDTINLVENMKVKGSQDNVRFYEYEKFITQRGKTMNNLTAIQKRLKESGKQKDSLAIVEAEIKKINKEVDDYKVDYMKKYPHTFLSTIFLASKDPEMPEVIKNARTREDTLKRYEYYKDHFWDNVDLTDDRILRTPIFANKVDQYFNRVVVQVPDTICKVIDVFVEKTRPNKETFKYAVWFLTRNYEESKIMGFDKVFVYIVDKYYRDGQAWWLSETVNKKIIDRADAIKPNLIGNVAPNLALVDLSEKRYLPIHSIKSEFTILYFWSYDCGHCAKETPKLVNYYKTVKDLSNTVVYAICTDTSITEWKKAVEEKGMGDFINVNGTRSALGNFHDLYDIFSTPVVYLLDSKKRIIAKRLPIEQIDSYLTFYRKHPMFED